MSDPFWDGDELGDLRGVVVDEATTVKTVKEPPGEPAQPPAREDTSPPETA